MENLTISVSDEGKAGTAAASSSSSSLSPAPAFPSPKKDQVSVFLSWDGTTESTRNVDILRKFLLSKKYFVNEHRGAPFSSTKKRGDVDDETAEALRSSTVLIICVSKAYTLNFACKSIALLVRAMQERDRKRAPEMSYVMICGDYTTESQPYKVSGWLGHLLKDSLWSPGWTHAHLAGAAEAVGGLVNLKRRIVVLDPDELLFIESRGKEGKDPSSGLWVGKKKGFGGGGGGRSPSSPAVAAATAVSKEEGKESPSSPSPSPVAVAVAVAVAGPRSETKARNELQDAPREEEEEDKRAESKAGDNEGSYADDVFE